MQKKDSIMNPSAANLAEIHAKPTPAAAAATMTDNSMTLYVQNAGAPARFHLPPVMTVQFFAAIASRSKVCLYRHTFLFSLRIKNTLPILTAC